MLFTADDQEALAPIFFRTEVESLQDLNPSDHLIMDSHHYLIKSTNPGASSFTAYGISGNKIVCEEHEWIQKVHKPLRVDYAEEEGQHHPQARNAVECAEEKLKKKEKWDSKSKCESEFITLVKCGKQYSMNEKCLISKDAGPDSCVLVTKHISLDQGDHLIIQDAHDFERYHSILVRKHLGGTSIISIPGITTDSALKNSIIDLSEYSAIYRVNYKHFLPASEVLKRALSEKGEEILKTCHPNSFISWAKTGMQKSVSTSELLLKQQQLISDMRPIQYERIFSCDQVQLGDHLFEERLLKSYRWHFMVTNKVNEKRFTLTYCYYGSIREDDYDIDPVSTNIYRIVYPEEFPTNTAIRNARSLLGKHKRRSDARMWFVRWAKTGSDEGLEVDFLCDTSLPTSKSQIQSFTQLNPGDYLVKVVKWNEANHHYLVEEVMSPTECRVIESRYRTVQNSLLQWDQANDNIHFYRINYEAKVCFPPHVSLQKALKFVGERTLKPMTKKFSRQKFVHFLKTGELGIAIQVDCLTDDRLLLQRVKIESIKDIMRGDHIERPLDQKLLEKVAYHHMLVEDVLDDGRCKVLHYHVEKTIKVWQKGSVKSEIVDIFTKDSVFRLRYPERIDPDEGILLLDQISKDKGKLKEITGKVN